MASGSKKVIYAALIGNSLIAVTKFIASSITGSSAMFSEGVHSLVDTGNQGLLLWGLKKSKLPADENYPFGHGKEIYFWSFVVAILIFALGSGISIYEGVQQLQHPHPIKNPTINYVVLCLAILFEGYAWLMAYREFSTLKGQRGFLEAVHRGKDPTTFVVLFEDSAAMIGLFIALFGVALGQWTGLVWIDGVAAILIGLVLAITAIWLAYETKSLLIGESAGKGVIETIRGLAKEQAGVDNVNEVLTLHMGPDFILVTISLDFRNDASASQLEASIASLDRKIKQSFPEVKRVFVEAEGRENRLP